MSLNLRVHPEAAAELDAAIAWHDQGGYGRGEVFEAAYDRVVDRCLLWPDSGSLYPAARLPDVPLGMRLRRRGAWSVRTVT